MGNCGSSINESLSLDRPGLIGTTILDAGQVVAREKLKKEVIHQIIPHITCLFNRKSQTTLEFGDACIKETVFVTGDIHNRDIA